VARLIGEIGCEIRVANDNCFHQVVIVVAPADEAVVHEVLRARGLESWTVGAIEKGAGEATCEVVR